MLSKAESMGTEEIFRSIQYSVLDKFCSVFMNSPGFENLSELDSFPLNTESTLQSSLSYL